MSPIKAAYLDTALGQIHYFVSEPEPAGGNNAQLPVLLLHMSASSARSMTALMPLLTARGFACYAPDMPGFGNSFNPADDPPGIAWYAALYHAAFAALPAFGGGCHLIGHHSGGIIGIELASNAAAYGAFVRSLTVVGAVVMTAQDRAHMAQTFGEPFNRPTPDGAHLQKTWDYLVWEGLSPDDNTPLLHRETLDHARAWLGRSQIYRCVWAYDNVAALRAVSPQIPVAGLCARDDVLWPYYANFRDLVALSSSSSSSSRDVQTSEIKGGNFGPDRDPDGIVQAFLRLLQ